MMLTSRRRFVKSAVMSASAANRTLCPNKRGGTLRPKHDRLFSPQSPSVCASAPLDQTRTFQRSTLT